MDDHDWNISLDRAIGVVKEAIPEHTMGVCCRDNMEDIIETLKGMKKKDITPEMVVRYKEDYGENCPHCGCGRITIVDDGDDWREYHDDSDGIGLSRGIACENEDCEAQWIEVFKLHTLLKEDEDE
jgi:hypothetical protein